MIRAGIGAILALAAAGCAAPRSEPVGAPTPEWFEGRVTEAEGRMRGYPELADVPAYVPTRTAMESWREGVEEMLALRQDVLTDPMLEDPDAEEDADAFTERARAQAEQEMDRLADEELD